MKIALSMGETWAGKPISDFGKNWIFIQADGKQMHLSTPTHKFREIIEHHNNHCNESEKLPLIRLHDLRHTSATLMISSGVDVRTAANRLGHSSPSLTLNVYAEALRSADQAAAKTLESLIG